MVDPQLRPSRAMCRLGEARSRQGKMVPVQGVRALRRETREHEMRAQRFPLPAAKNVGGTRRAGAAGRQEPHDARSDRRGGDDLAAGLERGFWMGRRILGQAGAISAVATQIMRGDLSQRCRSRADDEINTLAREINTMLDSKIEQLTLGMARCSTSGRA